jgi:hypothetical protein
MSHITKIAAIETATAIWEYDPDLPDNRVLGGSLDAIAAIRTVAIKACGFIYHIFHLIHILLPSDSGIGPTYRILPEITDRMQDQGTAQDSPPQQCPLGVSIQYARSLI